MAACPKAEQRAALLAARRTVSETVRTAEAQRLSEHLAGVVGGAETVCAYVPVGTEPGSARLLDRLVELDAEVLLPVAQTGPAGEHLPLRWGRYRPGCLVPAGRGLREPAPPWLPAEAIARADVVLVPALAVDRCGVRLGRGGGFYDRSLSLCPPGVRLVAVVRDDEVLDELPREPHDVLMTHVLTPAAGLRPLRECTPADGGSST